MDKTLFASCLFPVSLLVLLVHESVLHTSESNRDHNTEKKKDGSGIVRRMKDLLLNSKTKKKKNGLENKEHGMLKINMPSQQYTMRTHV
jgi:hypothetical protein